MESKIVFGKMLDYYRKQNNWTMEDLGNKLGKTKSAVSRWVSGENFPKIDEIERLSKLFNIDINTLVFGANNNMSILEIYEQLKDERKIKVISYANKELYEQNSVIKEDETLYISDYRQKVAVTEAVAAGRGFAYGDNEINYCYTDRSDLPRFDIASYITGDSMEPEYHDGDVVLIRKEMYSSPGVYVVDYDGKSYLKKVYQEKDRFRLVSFNEKYDDIMIDLPIADDVYLNIVGRVVGSFVPVSK